MTSEGEMSTLRASHNGDYDDGIRIEADEICYDWEERGLPEIDGIFSTRADALHVLSENKDYLEYRGYKVSLD